MTATTPSTSAIDQTILFKPGPKQIPKDITTEPLSLKLFNKVASDLNTKGIINLKKYNRYLVKNHQSLFRSNITICLTL